MNGNRMADGVPASRCGPICQHPGCWHTSTQDGYVQHKDTGCAQFLSELLLRRKELKRLQTRDGLHSSYTGDGLPTLKVQSINQKLLEGRGSLQRRRSKTLPPLKISTRKCAGEVISRCKEPPIKVATVNFVQMQLQVDQEALDSDVCSELPFLPVLLYRPGRKRHHSPSAPVQNTTASSEALSKGKRRGPEVDVSVRRKQAESMTRKKNSLPVKTTNLTDAALPPQLSSFNKEEKDGLADTPKHGKARHKLSTADAECFSYLEDIPPQVVAEIIHHLRSESSNGVDGAIVTPLHSSTHYHTHNPNHTTDKSIKAYLSSPQPDVSVPMASLPRTTHLSTSSNTTHIPASLAYELSSRRALKPEPVRPRQQVSSFSRELSKRPLEVLRRRSRQLYTRQEILEKIDVPKIVRSEDCGENVTRESVSSPVKWHSCQMHLPTAEIQLPTDLPSRVHPCYQPSLAEPIQGIPPLTHQHTLETGPSHARSNKPSIGAVQTKHNDVISLTGPATTAIEYDGGFQPTLPSTILLQLNTDLDDQHESQPLSSVNAARRNRLTSHIMHMPRHHLLLPKSTVVVCPFSEEASPNHELEARGLLLKRRGESRLQSRGRQSRGNYRQENAVSADEHTVHPPPLSSVSPDYMLVGAHFSDNNLVLMDKEDGRIVHQLTDTEGESDANIIAHLSELNIYTQTSIDRQVLQHTESLSLTEESRNEFEACRQGTRLKSSPSTTLEHGSDSVGGIVDGGQGLELDQVPKADKERERNEVFSEDMVLETQLAADCEEGEVGKAVKTRSQKEAQEVMLYVKSKAECQVHEQTKVSSDGVEATLPTTECAEDGYVNSKRSVQKLEGGANGMALPQSEDEPHRVLSERESEEVCGTDGDLLEKASSSATQVHREEEINESESGSRPTSTNTEYDTPGERPVTTKKQQLQCNIIRSSGNLN